LQVEQRDSEAEEEGLLVVSNSSVIIAFARICRLDLLGRLFKKVIVPETVWEKVTVEGKPDAKRY